MANHQIHASTLTNGAIVLVHGKTGFTRISRAIKTPEEIARYNQKRNSNFPNTKPFTTITIGDARLQPGPDGNLSREGAFIQERLYTSPKNPDRGLQMSHDNTGEQLPVVLKQVDDGNGGAKTDGNGNKLYEQVQLTGELESGQDVTLVFRFFKSSQQGNLGKNLERVILHSPQVKYYGNAAVDDQLAALGMVFTGPIVTPQEAQAPAGDQQQQGQQAPAPQQQTLVMPPMPTTPPAPQAAPTDIFRSQAPVQQQQAPQFAQPQFATAQGGSAFGAPGQDAPAPQPQAQPAEQAGEQDPWGNAGGTGISYQPNQNGW